MTNVNEIERRWIVTDIDPDIKTYPSSHLYQGYLELPSQIRIRIYQSKAKAELTRKTGKGLQRVEENHEISLGAADLLLEQTNLQIEKIRYVRDGWEIDFFRGKLEGLILAERELSSIDEEVVIPEWLKVGEEVTETLSNKQLAMTAQYMDGSVETLVRSSFGSKRIVITGGPCAGKSTIINNLRSSNEFHCVPELASVIIGQFGLRPDTNVEVFQRMMYKIQRSIEEGAAKQASKLNKTLIFDRGTLDSAGFISGGVKMFESIVGVRAVDEMTKYDVVVFVPVPSEEIYEASKHNNPVRRETWQEAKEAERKLLVAWHKHPNFVYLGSHIPFEERTNVVKSLVNNDELQKFKKLGVEDL